MMIGRQQSENVKNRLRRQATILGVFVAFFWLLEVVDLIQPWTSFDYFGGIHPRSFLSLLNIFTAPFLHDGFSHLIANTFPFIILGWLVMVRKERDFAVVAIIAGIVSGLGIWLFGNAETVHVGVSGVVFGFLGYLLFRGYFERSMPALLIALVTLFFYGSMIWGVLPIRYGISWQGHLFGFIGGGLAAYRLSDRNLTPVTMPDVQRYLRLFQR